ncbi:MAG: phosphodiesterase [Oscillatoria sp. SIO1A7]|nr:phosphodiesterase [Oscillatoria sp. SIO1A7]
MFDSGFYVRSNPDVAAAVGSGAIAALDHFIFFGEREGRNPSALFDRNFYLVNNPDVAAAVQTDEITGIEHFALFGQRESRNPSPLFDRNFYLANNPDVAAAVQRDEITGIEHFALFGRREGRSPSAFFSDRFYLAANPDVEAAVERGSTSGIEHYLLFGAAERREFTPFIEPGGETLPNGVASGDVTQNSAVLWTRTVVPGSVSFEYSTDPNFNNVIGTSTAIAADPTVPVKVQLTDLNPGSQYFYRVVDAAGTSAAGQFRTPAALGNNSGLRFGVSGDWQGHLTPYPAVANADDRNLDFFVALGDTIYADNLSPDLPGIGQPNTIEGFRTKHNEVYSQRFGLNTLADLRASTPIYATWDDHEVTNDFAGGAAPEDSPQQDGIFGTGSGFVNDTPVFDAALRAFQDYNPIRDEFYGDNGDPQTANEQKLYRANTHGNDAATFILDVRSFRNTPLLPGNASVGENIQFLINAFDPEREMLGAVQLQELKDDLLAAQNSGITWKFVMAPIPMQNFGVPLTWEAYGAERTDLLRFIEQNDINNVVFVSGDFHGYVVNNLTYQEGFGQPQIPTNAIDVVIGPLAYQDDFGQGAVGAPFGPSIVALTPDELLPQSEKDRYNALSDREERDAFVRQLIDSQILALGYDPIGLEGSEINAELLEGTYIGGHTFGWTEFEVDAQTQELTVTTYGVEPYSQDEIEANPEAIATQTPFVVSQFTIDPLLGNTGLPEAVQDSVQQRISQDFGIAEDNQTLVSAQQQTWPDGCLGLAAPGEVCTLALVDGWQVTVESGQQRFVYRTDSSGAAVRLDEAASVL